MANALNVTFAGPPEQRVKVSFTPMAKVQTILEQACSKMKPALDAALCHLVLHEGRTKRVVDLQVPFRLANIPTTANSKLEIVKVGDAAPPQGRPSTASQQTPPPASQVDPSPSEQPAADPAATSSPQAGPPPPPSQPSPQPSTSPAPAAAPEPSPACQPPWWQDLGLDREVVVFTKAALDSALLAAAAATGGPQKMDVSDDFYDLTPEDLATIAQSSKARREEAAQLKTSALREAAERAKARSYGPVPVRVHLPGNLILQAAFSALEPLSKLQELLFAVLVPQLARPGAFFLYTTPPKQVLRDLSLSFFKAQLVPAAHVHVHVAAGAEDPVLKPSILALLRSHLELEAALPGQAAFVTPEQLRQQEAAAAAAAGGADAVQAGAADAGAGAGSSAAQEHAAAAAAAAAFEAPRVTAAGSKLPKWLKLK